ncbi:hypothetical protein C8R45DRAFT_1164275, partial [Mycena sanguinolenta]
DSIKDKSKGDALSKSVVLVQCLWFAAQCLARVHQHLAVTELEIATMAFAVVNIFIWLLWLHKPLDVQQPVVIELPLDPPTQPTVFVQLSLFDRCSGAIFGFSAEKQYDPLPSFWSLPLDLDDSPFGILILVGTLFGAVHCAGWNADFPTKAEMWMWRAYSSAIAATPFIIFFNGLLLVAVAPISLFKGTMPSTVQLVLQGCLGGVGIAMYVLARLLLIVLPLIGLRSLPQSAFMDVNWSMYIPH